MCRNERVQALFRNNEVLSIAPFDSFGRFRLIALNSKRVGGGNGPALRQLSWASTCSDGIRENLSTITPQGRQEAWPSALNLLLQNSFAELMGLRTLVLAAPQGAYYKRCLQTAYTSD